MVIGGTSVADGYSSLPGLWGATLFLFLFLFLIETILNTFGPGAGIRHVLSGSIIIAVITLAGGIRVER